MREERNFLTKDEICHSDSVSRRNFEIILEVSSAIHGYGAIVMKAPVQSLETFWFVKWNCSIGMFTYSCAL